MFIVIPLRLLGRSRPTHSSLGNFRQLIKDISIDMQMLHFLDGLSNKASSPNENYARELLELFTLGKGEQVSQGDYTNYTEEDVRTLAKALTGWTVANWYSQDPNVQPTSVFQAFDHDTSTKQLSERFDNKTIEDLGDQEIFRVVDIVFEQPMAADYICRKLYRYFVHYDITAQVETDIIQPLAATLRANDFEIKPVLRQLLGSEHFFDTAERAALIKNPLDFVLDATLGLGLPVPVELDIEYYMYLSISWKCSEMTMDLQIPPTVAGYKAFYQSPLFNRHWINTSTLQLRHNLAKEVMWVGLWVDGVHRELDIFGFIENFDNPSDPNDLIAEFALRMYPKPLQQYQLDTLKGILIPGLPDFEWTIEYNNYLDANE